MKTILLCFVVMCYRAGFASAGQLVIATSDYESSNTAVYDIESDVFHPAALGQDDQDVMVDTDGEYVYFLSRSLGSVSKYDPAGITGRAADNGLIWQRSVGPASNPYDIVFLESKAYVIRYSSSEVLIVNQHAEHGDSFELGIIDISQFDHNGAPDAVHGFVYNGMVYVVLQRLNGIAAEIPGCLVQIDPATDSIVDLDPSTDGVQGRELLVKNPQHFSRHGGIAYIAGHDWGAQTEGVQTVDLADPGLHQEMVLDEESLMMDISGVSVFDNDLGIFYSTDWVQEGDAWIQVGAAYWFDPGSGEIGDVLPVPAPEGEAVKIGETVYVGSRDNSAPGVYPVSAATNTLAGGMLASTLPPTSLVYLPDDDPVSVTEDVSITQPLVLDAPYPNPFNPSVAIPFSLAADGLTRVDVFNIAGQRVATILNERLPAGNHSIPWNAQGMASGRYCIRVRQGNAICAAKVLLVK